MNLQDYMGAIWRRRWLVLAIMAVGLIAVRLVGQPGPATERYTATVTLGVAPEVDPASVLLYEQITLDTSEITDRVAMDVPADTFPGELTSTALMSRVDVESAADIGVIVLSVIDMPSEEMARTVIDSFTDNLLAFSGEERIADRDAALEESEQRAIELRDELNTLQDQERQLLAQQPEIERNAGIAPDRVLETEIEVAEAQLTDVQLSIEELRAQSDADLTSLRQVSVPTVTGIGSTDPLGANGRMAVALALSALLGVGLAVTLHRYDNRVFRRKDVESAFRLPVLAQVPHLGRLTRRNYPIIARNRPDHPASEAYRLLRSGLELARQRQLDQAGHPRAAGGTTILVVSASARAGRTTTAANLAAAAVAAGKRVLVVGADLRNSEIGGLLSVGPDAPGLSDAVAAIKFGRRAVLKDYVVPTAVPNVDMLPTGKHRINPGETLAEARFLIQESRRHYDMVIIDTPPMLVGNDVSELVPVSDLVLVVARAGMTTFDEGQWVDETAERLRAPTVGVVFIGARSDLQKASMGSRVRRALAGSRRSPAIEPVRSTSAPAMPSSARSEIEAGDQAAPSARAVPAPTDPAPTGEVPLSMGRLAASQRDRRLSEEPPDITDVFVDDQVGGRPGSEIDVEATIRMDVIDLNALSDQIGAANGTVTNGTVINGTVSNGAGGTTNGADNGTIANGAEVTGPTANGRPAATTAATSTSSDATAPVSTQGGGSEAAADPVDPSAGQSPDGVAAEPVDGGGPDAAADDDGADAPDSDELPTFPSELDDEQESISVVRVTTGRSAGPASSLRDDG